MSESVASLGYHFALSEADLLQMIKMLCQKNGCEEKARVRISVSGGNGFITDERDAAMFVIEAREMSVGHDQAVISQLGLFADAFKSRDALSNLKSSSAMIYAQAAAYGRANGMDDVLVLNSSGHIADSTIANVFVVTNKKIVTPSLPQACVNGVMRRWILDHLGAEMNISEGEISPEDLDSADEIFLTNALRGVFRVLQYRGRALKDEITRGVLERTRVI